MGQFWSSRFSCSKNKLFWLKPFVVELVLHTYSWKRDVNWNLNYYTWYEVDTWTNDSLWLINNLQYLCNFTIFIVFWHRIAYIIYFRKCVDLASVSFSPKDFFEEFYRQKHQKIKRTKEQKPALCQFY